jgi:hypothetical protein
MEDTPNVNNLNGVPNFGHGFPDNVPAEVAEEAVVAAEPEAALGVGSAGDITISSTEPSATEGMVEITSTNQE